MTRLDYEKAARATRIGTATRSAMRAETREQRQNRKHGFTASHAGTCVLCDHPIRPGQTIRAWNRAESRYAHHTCVVGQ